VQDVAADRKQLLCHRQNLTGVSTGIDHQIHAAATRIVEDGRNYRSGVEVSFRPASVRAEEFGQCDALGHGIERQDTRGTR
jgi:hypothetical protein